jgi:hypothetical protein
MGDEVVVDEADPGAVSVDRSWLREVTLGACPTLTFLLRRTIRSHLRRSQSEKILNVFQRIHLQFIGPAALHLVTPLSPRHEGNVGQAP